MWCVELKNEKKNKEKEFIIWILYLLKEYISLVKFIPDNVSDLWIYYPSGWTWSQVRLTYKMPSYNLIWIIYLSFLQLIPI